MDMTGEQRIPAPVERVWEALLDAEVLRESIPGCETVEKLSDTEFAATVVAKVGPVKAKFRGHVTLSDLDPPRGCTMSGEGQGGAAGFGAGEAKLTLTEENGETVLRYDVKARVGGKLAQIGSRLVDGAARKMADDFFARFNDIVAEGPPEALPESVIEEVEAEAIPAFAEKATGLNPVVWGTVLVAIVVAILYYLARAG